MSYEKKNPHLVDQVTGEAIADCIIAFRAMTSELRRLQREQSDAEDRARKLSKEIDALMSRRREVYDRIWGHIGGES